MSKKELNNNEIEKVSGGNSGEQRDGSRPWSRRPVMKYGGPRPYIYRIPPYHPVPGNYPTHFQIDEKIKKEQNKDKEEPEKGKLSE